MESAIRRTEDAILPETLPNPDLVAALPRLRRYARVLTGDMHRADDLVQDTLARAWEKRRLWRAGSDLRAWLFTIMHNVHVNQFSMRQREYAHTSIDADDGPPAGWELAVRATQADRATRGAHACRGRRTALRGDRSGSRSADRHRDVATVASAGEAPADDGGKAVVDAQGREMSTH